MCCMFDQSFFAPLTGKNRDGASCFYNSELFCFIAVDNFHQVTFMGIIWRSSSTSKVIFSLNVSIVTGNSRSAIYLVCRFCLIVWMRSGIYSSDKTLKFRFFRFLDLDIGKFQAIDAESYRASSLITLFPFSYLKWSQSFLSNIKRKYIGSRRGLVFFKMSIR